MFVKWLCEYSNCVKLSLDREYVVTFYQLPKTSGKYRIPEKPDSSGFVYIQG